MAEIVDLELAGRGRELVEKLKAHILLCMATMPDSREAATGLRSSEIERASGISLEISSQNGYIVWSLLRSLLSDGKIELAKDSRPTRYPRYRLPSGRK